MHDACLHVCLLNPSVGMAILKPQWDWLVPHLFLQHTKDEYYFILHRREKLGFKNRPIGCRTMLQVWSSLGAYGFSAHGKSLVVCLSRCNLKELRSNICRRPLMWLLSGCECSYDANQIR